MANPALKQDSTSEVRSTTPGAEGVVTRVGPSGGDSVRSREPEHVSTVLDRAWPLIRAYDRRTTAELESRAECQHLNEPCIVDECSPPCAEDGHCRRHRMSGLVAETAVQVQGIIEAALERANLVTDEELGRMLVEDILDNVRRALGVRA